jgi:HD-GYP domain-containing protein (c-di-GMP phosphodiesterase class II)
MTTGRTLHAGLRVHPPRPGRPAIRMGSTGLAAGAGVLAGAMLVLLWDQLPQLDLVTSMLAAGTVLALVWSWLLLNRAGIAAETQAEEVDRRVVAGLIAAVDARDHGVQDHADRVSRYALLIAESLSVSEARIVRLRLAAKLHDIGKLAVPESILGKPGPLTPEEFELVKTHCASGEGILAGAGLTDVAGWVRSHQERWDGSGYPDGLAGDAIPLESRILAGADALDAMTSDRPYRSALTPTQVRDEVRGCAGTHFDPRVAEAMIAIVDTGLLSSRRS